MCLLLAGISRTEAQPKTLALKTGTPVAPIEPTMWGLFFEDINSK